MLKAHTQHLGLGPLVCLTRSPLHRRETHPALGPSRQPCMYFNRPSMALWLLVPCGWKGGMWGLLLMPSCSLQGYKLPVFLGRFGCEQVTGSSDCRAPQPFPPGSVLPFPVFLYPILTFSTVPLLHSSQLALYKRGCHVFPARPLLS